MALGILARKIGMTQLFVDGCAVGTTVIEAKPCTVVQVKTVESDGYNEARVDDPTQYEVGDRLDVGIFAEGDKIDVIGTSRGMGFQGVVKRWNFAGGPKSHGSHFHRRPGSVGNCVNPGRVVKGKKLPGQMGNRRVTVKSLRVVGVDVEKNLVVVKGSTPGARGTVLQLRKSNG